MQLTSVSLVECKSTEMKKKRLFFNAQFLPSLFSLSVIRYVETDAAGSSKNKLAYCGKSDRVKVKAVAWPCHQGPFKGLWTTLMYTPDLL